MEAIRHRVGITVPREKVHQTLTTTGGLEGFWTRTLEGEPSQGGILRFFFGAPDYSAEMKVVEDGPERVVWDCTGGPEEWVGTTLTFDLQEADGETVVLFTHGGWREPVPFMHHCTTKWGVFLLGMRTWLQGGAPGSFPDDPAISGWG
jgi:uncharacterized protein YndB with AHSA1/START domain